MSNYQLKIAGDYISIGIVKKWVLIYSTKTSMFLINTRIDTEKTSDKNGKVFYKLLNNAVYSTTMENLRNRVDIRLVNLRNRVDLRLLNSK